MCNHFFVSIKEVAISNFAEGSSRPIETEGVLVMCTSCGQRKELYADGTIKELSHETK